MYLAGNPDDENDAREKLDRLADEVVLTEAAVREAAPWTPADSASHRALRDRLLLAAALDSELNAARLAAPSDSTLDADAVGLLARERVVAGLQVAWNDSAL